MTLIQVPVCPQIVTDEVVAMWINVWVVGDH